MTVRPDIVECREANQSDLDAVADIWHESARVAEITDNLPSRDELRSRIDKELTSGWDLTVAVAGNQIVAFLALKPTNSILDQLFVLPSRQGTGFGRLLLQHAMAKMPSGFTLRTMAVNQQAQKFYEKAGLVLIENSACPKSGEPVCFYRWQPGEDRAD